MAMLSIGFNLSDIINFLFGMLTGALLVVYIFIFLYIGDMKKKVKILKSSEPEISPEEIKKIIIDAQQNFKNQTKKSKAYVSTCGTISLSVLQNIAKHYFPNSKYPEYEISVNEFMELNHYITDRINEMIDRPIIRRIKNLNVSTVIDILNKKKAIDDNQVVKQAKKVSKVASYGLTALNIINPVYWTKKLIISGGATYLTKKVCLIIITIVGEETNNIYSKKLFAKPMELGLAEQEYNELLAINSENEVE